MAEEARLRNVAERFVQWALGAAAIGGGGPGPLHSEVDEAGCAAIAADPIDGPAIDPSLDVGKVGVVAAELPGGTAEGVERGIAGILCLQSEIERLAQVLSEEAEA